MLTWRQLRFRVLMPALVILTGILFTHQFAWAGDKKLPADIDSGLGYLYEFAAPETTTPFEVSRIDKLMAFVLAPKDDGASSAGHSGAFFGSHGLP